VPRLPEESGQRDGRKGERAGEEPAGGEQTPFPRAEDPEEERTGEVRDAELRLRGKPERGAHADPVPRIAAAQQAYEVERRERPQPEAGRVGGGLHAEGAQHRAERARERCDRLREPASAELAGEDARHVHRRGREERGGGAEQEQRLAGDLGQRGDERHERRLIDVPEGGVPTADDEVELVAKEPVMRIADQVDGERPGGGEKWQPPGAVVFRFPRDRQPGKPYPRRTPRSALPLHPLSTTSDES
jgi:hypothetical protein